MSEQTTPRASASTVLVVGATGHLGSQAARLLAQRGHHVRALVREPDRRIAGADDLDIEYVVGDLTDPDSIERAVRGADAIVSTANSIIPDRNPTAVRQLNALVGDVLVDTAVRLGVDRFVQSSVPVSEWGDRHVPELAGKRQVETALERSSLDYTIVRNPAFTDVWLVMCGCLAAQHGDPHATTRRPYGFMRTWQRLTGDLVTSRGRMLAPGGASHGSPLVATRDVASALAAAVDHPAMRRRTIEFGGPEWLTWREVAELFAERVGREVRTVAMPAWFANAGRIMTRPISRSASSVLALTTFVAKHQPRWDDAAVIEELGIGPRQTVAEYLDEHLQI